METDARLPGASRCSLGSAFSKLSSTKEEGAAAALPRDAGANAFFHIKIIVCKPCQGSGQRGLLCFLLGFFPCALGTAYPLLPRQIVLFTPKQFHSCDSCRARKT